MPHDIDLFLLRLLTRQTLKRLAALHRLEPDGDRRWRSTFEKPLSEHYQNAEGLFQDLRRTELVEICSALGLPQYGARNAVEARLVQFLETDEAKIIIAEHFADDLVEDDSHGSNNIIGGSSDDIATGLMRQEVRTVGTPAQIEPTQQNTTEYVKTSLTPVLEAFRLYCDRRYSDGDLRGSEGDVGFCPNCKTQHPRTWAEDRKFRNRFFLCQVVGTPVIVVSGFSDPRLNTLQPAEFMVSYPALPAAGSLLSRAFPRLFQRTPARVQRALSKCQFEVTMMPPFINVIIPLD